VLDDFGGTRCAYNLVGNRWQWQGRSTFELWCWLAALYDLVGLISLTQELFQMLLFGCRQGAHPAEKANVMRYAKFND
jgi:hypothetical protein